MTPVFPRSALARTSAAQGDCKGSAYKLCCLSRRAQSAVKAWEPGPAYRRTCRPAGMPSRRWRRRRTSRISSQRLSARTRSTPPPRSSSTTTTCGSWWTGSWTSKSCKARATNYASVWFPRAPEARTSCRPTARTTPRTATRSRRTCRAFPTMRSTARRRWTRAAGSSRPPGDRARASQWPSRSRLSTRSTWPKSSLCEASRTRTCSSSTEFSSRGAATWPRSPNARTPRST